LTSWSRKSQPAPAFPPMGSPFQGPYCLRYLPLVWPGAVLGYEVVREVIYPFPWFVPLAGQFPSRRRPVLHAGASHAGSRLLAVSENCAGAGFLRRAPSTKIPRWDRKFGYQHFFTKTGPIRARRVCKKGPLKARGRLGTEGRPLLLAKAVFSGGARSSVTGTPSRPGALPPSG
jgi:hypothetical protein